MSAIGFSADSCVVLMMKAAPRSKRRLASQIGELATEAAELLMECAREDLEMWPGPICIAPSIADEAAALESVEADAIIVQQGDNLGERINYLNGELADRGFERQLFIGIDCPTLDAAYLESAGAALQDCTTVFGPALDGGVVLMGVHGYWPDLAGLPWSSDLLFDSLYATCARAGASAELLEPLRDVDTLEDLLALRTELDGDPRPARKALVRWLANRPELRPQ